jgi:Nif-specific regulatory protein
MRGGLASNQIENSVNEAYLFINEGVRSGTQFRLDPDNTNRMGRGLECDIVTDDPKCSRVHATVELVDDNWWISDAGSSNGTVLDGKSIKRATLNEGSRIKIGETLLVFGVRDPNIRPAESEPEAATIQTVVLEESSAASNTSDWAFQTLRQQTSADDVYFIFDLSIHLMSTDDPDEVIRLSLNRLAKRVQADVAGFLWTNDKGELTPQLVIPSDQVESIKLTASITELVARQKKAVRMDHRDSAKKAKNNEDKFADSICTPLVYEDRTLGAIHLYKTDGNFRSNDLQLAQSVTEMTVRCLVRARQHSQLRVEHQRLRELTGEFDEMIGDSAPMVELKRKIKRIAAATGCVLVRGESGAGKELVARALHRQSPRSDRPMLSVNCAAIPRDLMESQLFGHKKGAFTGADADHIGWFQQADAGTLFLDEIGELNLEGQAKLLRILEGHPFLPVGSTKQITVDVRVICATNRDLADFVAEKKFREDLFYRLSVFELVVPAVRERGADIGVLIDHFVSVFALRHGRTRIRLSSDARSVLLGYQWPGNVRQIRNVIDSAVVMSESETIQPSDLTVREVNHDEQVGGKTLRIDHWERELIKEALQRTSNSVPKAAKLLGLSRATLYRKIEDYGIDRK